MDFNQAKKEYHDAHEEMLLKLRELELAKIDSDAAYKRMITVCDHQWTGHIIKTCSVCNHSVFLYDRP